RTHVKNLPYRCPTRLLRPRSPSSRLIPSAATPRSGSPTPVIRKPAAACHILLPASCPMDTGKIRFPAPKNIPKSMLATHTVSFLLSDLFISSSCRYIFSCKTLITYYNNITPGSNLSYILSRQNGFYGRFVFNDNRYFKYMTKEFQTYADT